MNPTGAQGKEINLNPRDNQEPICQVGLQEQVTPIQLETARPQVLPERDMSGDICTRTSFGSDRGTAFRVSQEDHSVGGFGV